MENKKRELSKTEKMFIESTVAVFGRDFWTFDNETLFKKILIDADKRVKCGDYGDCKETIDIMLQIRNEMIQQNLASSSLESYLTENTKIKRDIQFCEFRTKSIQTKFWEYFPRAFIYDVTTGNRIGEYNTKYSDDGWKGYINEDYRNWNIKEGEIIVHYYFNQLDHFFTHLIGNIRKGMFFYTREKGLKKIKEEIECIIMAMTPGQKKETDEIVTKIEKELNNEND